MMSYKDILLKTVIDLIATHVEYLKSLCHGITSI